MSHEQLRCVRYIW